MEPSRLLSRLTKKSEEASRSLTSKVLEHRWLTPWTEKRLARSATKRGAQKPRLSRSREETLTRVPPKELWSMRCLQSRTTSDVFLTTCCLRQQQTELVLFIRTPER